MTETVTIETRACMFCGVSSRVELTARQAAALAARRELLISGTHPDCWARAFG